MEEEVFDGVPHAYPELFAVRFKNGPLRALIDGSFEIGEVAPEIDVFPFRIGTDGARGPEPETAA